MEALQTLWAAFSGVWLLLQQYGFSFFVFLCLNGFFFFHFSLIWLFSGIFFNFYTWETMQFISDSIQPFLLNVFSWIEPVAVYPGRIKSSFLCVFGSVWTQPVKSDRGPASASPRALSQPADNTNISQVILSKAMPYLAHLCADFYLFLFPQYFSHMDKTVFPLIRNGLCLVNSVLYDAKV